MNKIIMIDDEIDNLSQGQLLVITFRAAKKAGYEVEWTTEGTLNFPNSTEILLSMDENFLKAWNEEACLFVASLMTARLVAEGVLYVDYVDEDGEAHYKAVPDC